MALPAADSRRHFWKMAATGNDFIIFDNRTAGFTGNETAFFHRICTRRSSAGADGVILLDTTDSVPVSMRYFNSDGREADMCGNGGRAAAWLARRLGLAGGESFVLGSAAGSHRVHVSDTFVRLELSRPRDFEADVQLADHPALPTASLINTGVPHLGVFGGPSDQEDITALGRELRHGPMFPEGVNVNFISSVNKHTIRVRTYERGVEAETLSCGTGCAAAALISHHRGLISSPVTVLTRGGELTVEFDDGWQQVTLGGAVELIYEGTLQGGVS